MTIDTSEVIDFIFVQSSDRMFQVGVLHKWWQQIGNKRYLFAVHQSVGNPRTYTATHWISGMAVVKDCGSPEEAYEQASETLAASSNSTRILEVAEFDHQINELPE